jgi:hypothetical protein
MMVGGLGVFSARLMLSLGAFPKGAERNTVHEATLTQLALNYVPTVIILHIAAIAALSLFRMIARRTRRTLTCWAPENRTPSSATEPPDPVSTPAPRPA